MDEDICENLQKNKSINSKILSEVAQFEVYESVIDYTLPIFMSVFLGNWNDKFGSKYLLYLFFVCSFISRGTDFEAFMVHSNYNVFSGGLLLCSYFMSWPKEYILFLVNLPVALSGGHIAIQLGQTAYMSDISKETQRTFRY